MHHIGMFAGLRNDFTPWVDHHGMSRQRDRALVADFITRHHEQLILDGACLDKHLPMAHAG